MIGPECKARVRQSYPHFVIEDACKIDSIERVRRGFDLASTQGKNYPEHDKLPNRALYYAVTKGALSVLEYLLSEHPEKPSLEHMDPHRVCESVPIPMLEILVRHGWDINQRPKRTSGWGYQSRLLNLICHDDEMMHWALEEHGATVSDELEDDTERHKDPYRDWYIAPSLLDSVTYWGSLEMMEHFYHWALDRDKSRSTMLFVGQVIAQRGPI